MTTVMARRDRLCEAAIAVIARSGLRGLTHRAVDDEAGLPRGSTSYYFRTRLALLTGITQRLAEVDTADVPVPTLTPPIALDEVADLAADMVTRLTGPGRTRMLARYEISLEATRHPELRAALDAAGQGLRTMATRFLEAAGACEPRRQGRDFVACVDGLLYDQLAGAGGARSTADIRATLREVLRGMTGR